LVDDYDDIIRSPSPTELGLEVPSTTPASTFAQHQFTSTDTMSKKPHDNSDNSHDAKRAPGDISSVGRDLRCMCLALHRSDGTEVWRDGVNGPTDDMLDQSPDENGDKCYMKLVERKEKKMREWLKYLGEELVKASTDVEKKQALQDGTLNFTLHALPTGYRLYEQILVPVCLLAWSVD
jgi:hypothetical protein